MMAERQVVILREAQEMKGLADLTAYFEQPMQTTVFVVCHKHKKFDARTKAGKVLQGKTTTLLFESAKLYDNQVPDWIIQYCKSKKINIESDAANQLAELLGADLSKIANEIEKLIIGLPKGQAIQSKQVLDNVGISKDFNIFELQKAFAHRDIAKVNLIEQYFASNIRKNPLIMTISSLYGYFSKVYMLQDMANRPDAEILKALELRSEWFLKDYKVAAKNYHPDKVKEILHQLRVYDLRSKGVDNDNTNTGEDALMQELFWKILH
jgi:DNA polymerase III subunit delta